MSGRGWALVLATALCHPVGLSAQAEEQAPTASLELLPGPSRAITTAISASPDNGALEWHALPRGRLKGGGDLALLSVTRSGLTLRLGFLAFMELESTQHTTAQGIFPIGNVELWRGHTSLSIALSLDELGRRWLGQRGQVELYLAIHHESEHFTGDPEGNGPRYDDVPHIGNYLLADAAVRLPFGSVDLEVRPFYKGWLPDPNEQAYTHGLGGDLIGRWRLRPRLHPYNAAYGEYRFGHEVAWMGHQDKAPDAWHLRDHLGLVFPARHVDLYAYTSLEAGSGKGLMVFEKRLAWGGGFRIATTFSP